MSELDDVRAEVAALRDEVADTRALAAMADRDAAGVRAAINAINKTQNALRETQVEHGHILERVSDAVGVLVTGQFALEERADRQSEVLARHSDVLAQHSEAFARQDQVLARHSDVLAQHSEAFARQDQILARHSDVLAQHSGVLAQLVTGQVEILRRLPPAPPPVE